jgi:hypothetical protein
LPSVASWPRPGHLPMTACGGWKPS